MNTTYGDILDYRTSLWIRRATREDWLYAREHGEKPSGAYIDPETKIIVYCDGPKKDPV